MPADGVPRPAPDGSGGVAASREHLSTRTWPDLEAARGRTLVVPVGATEQHGPHLPLTVDTDIAVAVAARLAEGRDDVLVAPPVHYGASGEHQAFPGTLSIGLEVTELVLVELGRSATHTVDRVVFLSTHGGNASAVARAAARLRDEGRDARGWSPRWGGDAHAGRAETSLMLAIAPDRVRTADARPGNTGALVDLLPAMREGGVVAVSDNGILGDPTGATAAEGEALLSRAAAELGAVLDAWVPRGSRTAGEGT
ncbi:mycofactocin biosynthesis peptidyl-dipeptidase MftE [Patulibacter minatonensis]|uniref:mycofactocin biosynthesis peptidyl-dipeptidase MftE n=1 Tax=Patulibacter minatonensis TaxID=298163 RepID=UPI0006855001|nr:mycofactocin biosynthesis peptidyl-dipeptidase MftE [Patulibacter minatonensis]